MTAYHQPTDLGEALGILSAAPMTIAAGCTDLFPATQAKSLSGAVLDITRIPALRGVAQTGEGWRIGAATTWADLIRADLPPGFNALRQAAREVGSVQIQNVGTVAGNLCTASPAGDGAPCWLVLDAQIEIRSVRGERRMPLEAFLIGPRHTALAPDEIVTALHVPNASGRSGFQKLGARRYLVISIAMVAARLRVEAGVVQQAALAVGACSPVATRLPEQEAALIGVTADEAVNALDPRRIQTRLSPIDDIRGDGAYRVDAAMELLRRALREVTAPIGAAG